MQLHALAVSKQVFGAIIGDLTKVFGSYANDLTSFWHYCQGLNIVFGSYANNLTTVTGSIKKMSIEGQRGKRDTLFLYFLIPSIVCGQTCIKGI